MLYNFYEAVDWCYKFNTSNEYNNSKYDYVHPNITWQPFLVMRAHKYIILQDKDHALAGSD